jgi:hypothetical protein
MNLDSREYAQFEHAQKLKGSAKNNLDRREQAQFEHAQTVDEANKVVRGEAWVPEVFPQAEASALPGDVSEVVEIFCQEEAERDGFFASRLQAEFYSRLQDEDDEVVAAAAAEAEHERLCQEEAERLQAEDDEIVAAAAAEAEHEVVAAAAAEVEHEVVAAAAPAAQFPEEGSRLPAGTDFTMQGATPDEVRRTLGSVITRPELKDAFLSKPPFRFIHDVFSNVTACTGFGKGLFADLETDDRENIWTSGKSGLFKVRGEDGKFQHRATYLSRIIRCVEIANDSRVDETLTQHMLSGTEPQQTWAFLIALAQAATENCALSASAVKCVHKLADGESIQDRYRDA